MKKTLTLLFAAAAAAMLTACDANAVPEAAAPAKEGRVFNIYAWNDEFKGFFEKYYADRLPEGVEVKWTIVPPDNGAYQDALDAALLNQEQAEADEKVDMFLAEADYILKYTDSAATQDITKLGVTDFSNTYKYTVEAASDPNGVIKGVSFQCCPSGLIYRRSIAKDILGTDDPEAVQKAVGSWKQFDETARKAKEKGYLMTASFAETYRAFSNNVEKPWIDADNHLQFDDQILRWMDQAEDYVKNGYTLTESIWGYGKNAEMGKNGRAFCFFGPAWYFNFCMTPAHEEAMGDWAIVKGPQAYFWGGTWLLAPTGSDNPAVLTDIMNTFMNDESVCEDLIRNESQFTNNRKVNQRIADDASYGSEFLGGQNDVAVFADLTGEIVFQNQTVYDQYMNEGLQNIYAEYLKGILDSRDTVLQNFYAYINKKVPEVITP